MMINKEMFSLLKYLSYQIGLFIQYTPIQKEIYVKLKFVLK